VENRDKFEQDLKMLEYFQSEFEYRHQHYWRILERFFILFIVVATLPILKGLLGIEILGEFNRHVVVFQIAALAIAVIQLIVLLDEGKKISAVNKTKYELNKRMEYPRYRYYLYSEQEKKKKTKSKEQPKGKEEGAAAEGEDVPAEEPASENESQPEPKKNRTGLAQLLPILVFIFQLIIIASILILTYI
jgi:hypothetical protein